LTLALTGNKWLASRPSRFTPGKRASGIHWIGDWVDPRAGLDDLEERKFLCAHIYTQHKTRELFFDLAGM
jgi:hypothetical protein